MVKLLPLLLSTALPLPPSTVKVRQTCQHIHLSCQAIFYCNVAFVCAAQSQSAVIHILYIYIEYSAVYIVFDLCAALADYSVGFGLAPTRRRRRRRHR